MTPAPLRRPLGKLCREPRHRLGPLVGRDRVATAIAVALLAGAASCVHPVGQSLRGARQGGAALKDFSLTYEERSAAWGGRRIEVDGAGKVQLYVFRPGFAAGGREDALDRAPGDAERVSAGQVDPGHLRELVDVLLALEVWEQRSHGDRDRVDSAKARLRLRVGGQASEIWELSDDLETNDRLLVVRRKLESLAREAKPLTKPATGSGQATGAPEGASSPAGTADAGTESKPIVIQGGPRGVSSSKSPPKGR